MEWPPHHPGPCTGWSLTETAATFLRTGDEHSRSADKAVTVFDNVTALPNPACTPECVDEGPCADGVPTMLTPQTTPILSPRPDCAEQCGSSFGPCGELIGQTRCNDEPFTSAASGTAPCGPWPEPLPVGNVYNNTYVATTKTVDLSVGRKRGFKNAYAMKIWHGADGFTADGCSVNDNSYSIAFSDCSAGFWWLTDFCTDALDDVSGNPVNISQSCTNIPEQLTNLSRTRYRTVSVTATLRDGVHFTEEGDWNETITTFAQTASVDRYTGKVTVTGCSSTVRTIAHQFPDGTISSDTTASDVFPVSLAITDLLAKAQGCPANETCPHKHFHNEPEGAYGVLTVTVTPTEYHYSYDGTANGRVNGSETLDMVLSDEYTDVMLNADVDELLAQVDFYNDAQHPWRMDSLLNQGPLVTRNERPGRISPLDFIGRCKNEDGTPWTDSSKPPRPSLPDGAILGIPNPAGYGRYFDLQHIKYAFKEVSGGEANGFVETAMEYGQYAPSWAPHATQWTDERHARDFPAGPFVCLGGREQLAGGFLNPICLDQCLHSMRGWTDTLIKCKWAETIMFAKPPVNFKRPCGFYDTTELDISRLSIGSADCIAVPFVGTPRWPDAPCGCDDLSRAIVDASNATPIVIRTGDAHDYDDGGMVNICRVRGNKAANGIWRLSVVDGNRFALYDKDTGEASVGNGDYSGGGTADILDFSSYWNSFWRQGKFLFKAWNFVFRDFAESYRVIWQKQARANQIAAAIVEDDPCDPPCPTLVAGDPVRFVLDSDKLTGDGSTAVGNIIKSGSKWIESLTVTEHCVPFSPCCPSAVYVQPTGYADAPCGGRIIEMPALELDYRYGTMWFGRVEQWMPEPLWRAPGRGYEQQLCTGLGAEDVTGGCSDLSSFPQRNYVEAIAAVPVGAPELPADARELGCPSYIDRLNTDGPTPSGQDLAPAISECDAPYAFDLEFHGTLGSPDPDHPARCADDDPYIDGCCTVAGVTRRYDGYWLYANNGYGPHIELVETGGDDAGTLYTVRLAHPWTPWIWLNNQEGCVRGNGKFATTYKRNGIVL